ncbi:putative transposase [Paracholeplasma brassicae]|uniref:Putative transposase n=2 Tax=Acholeplasma brassicae TaxID=61635 RepID=U4KQB7_9MOLU|nr:putative transposase [Paracholeplasma brassicae]
MCLLLGVPRSNYYYEINRIQTEVETIEDKEIIQIFEESTNRYGSRKIKFELSKKNIIMSRKKIRKIMERNGLVSCYIVFRYKPTKSSTNEQKIESIVSRSFDNYEKHEVVVSDLTYVNVAGKWNYICILIDLFNREIIGYSYVKHKDANLVQKAFYSLSIPIKNINIFHTDRGKEFDNQIIDEILSVFEIIRSLSRPGNPYDNAVAESTFKSFKIEFGRKRFDSFEQLETELFEYVYWFNNKRIHGSLGYLSPVEYRNAMSI